MSALETLRELARLKHCVAGELDRSGAPSCVVNLTNGMCVRLAKDHTGWFGGLGKEKLLSVSFAPFELTYNKHTSQYESNSSVVLGPADQAKLLATWRAQELKGEPA